MSQNIKLSIIIPAYNESLRIGRTIKYVANFLYKNKTSFEIIVVPNNCTDNTIYVVEELQKEIPEIKIVTISNMGVKGNTKGLAIKKGMQESAGDYAIFIDADNATKFDHVLDFITCAENGADVVIGSRYINGANIVKKQPIMRVILSRIGNLIIRSLLLPGIYDTQCGFKLFSKRAVDVIFPKTTIYGWGLDLEILALAKYFNFKIKELGVVWEAQDSSTLRSNAFINTLKELFKIRKNIKNRIY
jgi:dolichyl-phosphate beta-glucosyltransferase